MRDSHAHIGAHLIYRLPSCHMWTASSSHTTSKQMRRLPTRPLKKKQYLYNMQIIPNLIQLNIQIIIT